MFRLLPGMSAAAVSAAWLFAQFAGAAAAQPKRPPVRDVPPGETGRRITENGLVANYFPARQRAPAVLTLGGSVGGLTMNDMSVALQAEGVSVLHLSYFRGPGQNQNAELIPLEYFATAIAWLQRQPEVDPARVGIVGGSKGAEAALVVAVRHPELKAIVAALPSSVVWPGIIWEPRPGPISSSWSEQGKPVPHLPHVPYDASKGGTMADNYAASLEALPRHPESVIPVERIGARMLLVCGERDQIWPSCPMARQIQDRLRAHGRPAATLLAYDDAGHLAFGFTTAARRSTCRGQWRNRCREPNGAIGQLAEGGRVSQNTPGKLKAEIRDPQHVDVPLRRLLSTAYAEEGAAQVDNAVRNGKRVAVESSGGSGGGTVHLSASDRDGNMVALTLTHGNPFGARVTVDGLGLTLGHGMARFDPRPGRPNSPGPGKRPLHNMCPTVVLKNDAPVLALGGAGFRMIPNAVFEVLARFVGRDAPLEQAIAAPASALMAERQSPSIPRHRTPIPHSWKSWATRSRGLPLRRSALLLSTQLLG